MSEPRNDNHAPGPSLWPIGFAIGVACLLVGLVISWIVAAIGAALAIAFGLLWAREVTREVRGEVPEIEPETRAVADEAAPLSGDGAAPLPLYTRSRFLEATTIGLGAAIPLLRFVDPDPTFEPVDLLRYDARRMTFLVGQQPIELTPST